MLSGDLRRHLLSSFRVPLWDVHLKPKGEMMMKRTIVVLGVLAVFLFTTFGAYALENNTWGRIKATFSESPSKASDDLQLLPGEVFQRVLAKPVLDEKVSKLITADKGGKVKLDLGWVKMEVKIKRGALEKDMTITLYVEKDKGISWLVVEGSPDQTCTPPAKLKIEAEVLLSGVDPGSITLVHQSEEGDDWKQVEADIKVKVDKKEGTAKIKVKAELSKFSRYALAGSRR